MDRKIEKKKWTTKKIALYGSIGLLTSLIFYTFVFATGKPRFNAEISKITVATVNQGGFQEYIPVIGNVLPSKTIFLDAIQNGTINQIYKESGMLVKKGDTILIISNSNLQLDVMSQESQLYEQINHLRNTRLALDQNILNQQAVLAEVDYQLQLLKPKFNRYQQLYDKKLISKREYEDVKEQYDYNVKKKKIVLASYQKDSVSRSLQLQQLNQSDRRMIESLDGVRGILDDLIIKSPADGQISTPELQIGQSISTGERLGQVDILGSYKVRVGIDELYLPRISVGQKGSFEFSDTSYQLVIAKIYPAIANGKFEVDMEFSGKTPEGIKRGQSFHIRLELGNSSKATLLPVGGFYQDTGGNWVFVLDQSGKQASKRIIRSGRRNPEYIEILDGLQPGEKVITSSYQSFGDSEIIVLK